MKSEIHSKPTRTLFYKVTFEIRKFVGSNCKGKKHREEKEFHAMKTLFPARYWKVISFNCFCCDAVIHSFSSLPVTVNLPSSGKSLLCCARFHFSHLHRRRPPHSLYGVFLCYPHQFFFSLEVSFYIF